MKTIPHIKGVARAALLRARKRATRAPAPAPLQLFELRPSNAVVHQLEKHLEAAKCGDLQGFVMVGFGRATGCGFVGTFDNSDAIGQLQILQHRLVHLYLQDRGKL